MESILHFSSFLLIPKLNLSPIVKCGYPPSGEVRKVRPSNQISFLIKSYNKKSLKTISARFKCELKRQKLMNKSSLINWTRGCMNEL